MKNQRKFFKCEHCGNLVGMINDSGVSIVCCGEKMKELVANTTDAALEKHVPAIEKQANKLIVTVGSTLHPMSEEHHISWIAVANGKKTHRIELDHEGTPKAEFCVEDGETTVYAYCNLHGLWSSDI